MHNNQMYHGTNVNFTLFSTGGPLSRASSRYDKNKHSYVSSSKGYSSSTGTESIVHVGGGGGGGYNIQCMWLDCTK